MRTRSFLILFSTLFLLVCLVLAGLALRYRPNLPAEAIAYTYSADEGEGIYALAPDGSERVPLIVSQADGGLVDNLRSVGGLASAIPQEETFSGPAWIAGGSDLTYHSRILGRYCDEIVVIDANEREPQVLTCLDRDARQPAAAWSPDGRYFAYAVRDEGSALLRLLDAQGSQLQLFYPDGQIWGAAWSPDSGRLAVTVDDGVSLHIHAALNWGFSLPEEETAEDVASLHIYRPDGSAEFLQPEAAAFDRPTWSPDGQSLAFLCYYKERIDICTINADGSDFQRIELPPGFPYHKTDLHWSPAGDRLLFAVQAPPYGLNDLFLMNPDGSELMRLTTDPAADSHPAWSPDGQQIAFVSNRDGNWELYVINVDGSGLARLTDTPGDESEPAWRK